MSAIEGELIEKGVLVTATEETDEIILRCRNYYRNVQKTWYMFAKSLKEVKDKEIYRAHGTLNLKEFCAREFPSINYGTIVKTIKVVEKFGPLIDAKLKDDPTYTLPAYESCYQLINAEDKIPTKKHKDLVKKIFDGKVSFYRFREEMKRLVQIESDRAREESGITEEKLEQELLEDIDTSSYDDISDEVEDVSGQDVDKLVNQLSVKIDYVRENLPLLTQNLETNPSILTDDAIEFANTTVELRNKIDEFVELMGSLCE